MTVQHSCIASSLVLFDPHSTSHLLSVHGPRLPPPPLPPLSSSPCTCQDALSHPYLADYHYPDDEPVASRRVDLGFEKMTMTKQELQLRMIR